MAFNTPTEVNKTYDPKGASVLNGIRGGRDTLPNNPLSPGIQLGQVYTSYYRMNNATPIYTVAVPGNTSLYVTMSNLLTANNNFTIVNSQSGNYVQLSHPMRIGISTSASSINVEISGYDQYDQPMINGNPPSVPITSSDVSPRCFNRLTAIKLINVTSTPATVTISSTISLELPYFDFGKQSLLLNVRNPQRPLFQALANTANSPITWDFAYVGATVNAQTLNPITESINLYGGFPRSIITLNAFEADGGSGNIETIAVRQGVYGYGSVPSWFIDSSAIPSLINGSGIVEGDGTPTTKQARDYYQPITYSMGITGHPQYNIGWKGWQG